MRPVAAAAVRLLHSSAARRADGAAAGSGDKNDADDLDDLFGEEMDLGASKAADSGAAAGAAAAAGGLSSLLSATRRATAASQAARDSEGLQRTQARGEQLVLLDPSNPPRLDSKHFALLQHALRDVRAKQARMHREAKEAALQAGTDVQDALAELEADAGFAALGATETKLAGLCRQLFPPEQELDDRKVGELLDYAESMPGVMHLVQPDAVDPLKLMALDQKTTRANRHMFCLFCKPSTAILERNTLVYTNLNLLTQFLNERGMILQRDETRLCMKHQRAVARTIKQARNIGLLSPLSNWRVPAEYVYGREGAKFHPNQAAEIHAGGGEFGAFTSGSKGAATDLSSFEAQLESFGDRDDLSLDTLEDEDDFTDSNKPAFRK